MNFRILFYIMYLDSFKTRIKNSRVQEFVRKITHMDRGYKSREYFIKGGEFARLHLIDSLMLDVPFFLF